MRLSRRVVAPRRRAFAVLAATAIGTVGTACGADTEHGDDGRLVVAAAFAPLEDIVRAVAGDDVEVLRIVPPGESAHEYEPTARQLTALDRADVVVYLGGDFQPTVQKIIENLPGRVLKVDLLQGLDQLPPTEPLPGSDDTASADDMLAGGGDPHVWLDPQNMSTMTEAVATAIVTAAPDLTDRVTAAAASYRRELAALDEQFRSGLDGCATTYLVTAHRAFAYLTHAYGLQQVAVAGISPRDEPSARSLEAVAEFVRSNDIPTVFVEAGLDSDLIDTIAAETGAHVATLSNAETFTQQQLAAGVSYLTVMRDNLTAIASGLDCS